MKKVLACVFAHPDDEAFGPGGTIAKFAKTHDVYVLCATKGEAGKDNDENENRLLGERRAGELRRSAEVLGVKRVYFLGFKDGTLSNGLYHQLAQKIERILLKLKPETILTFDQNGISGHIDHVTVSFVTTFVFRRLKSAKRLMYYCLREERTRLMKNYFIYVPVGKRREDVDLVVNTKNTWETKLKAMREHASQIHDVGRILKILKRFPKEEYFMVFRKGQI